MKYIYTILFVLVFSFSFIRSQIPNAGFENWANGDPVGWATLDFLGDAVSQTSESHSGSSAAKMQIIDFMGSPIPPILISGEFGVSEKFGSLTGYFKFMPQNNNQTFTVAVLMSQGSNYIGGGAVEIFQTTSAFTQFVVPIEYAGSEVPDSAYIQFVVADTSEAGGGIGSYAIIDDLSFGGPTDVHDNIVTVDYYKLEQNYPNPFNPITTINYSIPSSSFVQLIVYNSIGQEIANLVNETIAAGNHNIEFDASNLPSGIYFYKLQAGSFVETKKMILLK
jgi:hypothetical protein